MTIIKANKKTSLETAVLVVGLYAAAIDLAKLCQVLCFGQTVFIYSVALIINVKVMASFSIF